MSYYRYFLAVGTSREGGRDLFDKLAVATDWSLMRSYDDGDVPDYARRPAPVTT